MVDRIIINFGAETREVEVAGRKMSDVLKDTEDALDDVGASGEDAGRQASDALDDTAKASDGVKNSLSEVGGAATKFVKGDLGGAVEDVASTVTIMAGSLIPGVGAALGVLAAEGIGAITSGLQEAQKQADELKTRLTSAYQSAVDEGRALLDENQIIAASNEIIFDPTQRKQYQEDAAAIGVDATTLIRAMSGDEAALNEVLAQGVQLRDDQKAKTEGMVGANGEVISSYDSQLTKLNDVVGKLEAQKATTDEIKQGVALAQQIRGQDYELMQKQNKLLAETPKTITTKLEVDTSALDAVERQQRTIVFRADLRDPYGSRIV